MNKIKLLSKFVFLALLFIEAHGESKIDLIESIKVHKNRLDVKINKEFKEEYLEEDFFIEYDKDINLEKLDYSIVIMPFIMNVMSIIWVSGKEYHIKSMDKEVYDSLERVKSVFKVLYPKTKWTGRLIPKKLVTNKIPSPQDDAPTEALLFSGGLDSTCSSLTHRDKKQLLITAWGQCGLPLDDPKMWQTIQDHAVGFAQQYGHANTFIRSNYYYFLNFKKLGTLSPEIVSWRIYTIEDIGWAGMIAPILFTHGIKTLRIASSDCWGFPYPSAANPFIDSNIKFAGISLKHDQFELSRFDKTLHIASLRRHHLVAIPKLIVCQTGGRVNCSRCEKCLLTIISLMASGENPADYGFAKYEAVKERTLTLLSKDKLSASGIWQFVDIQKKLPKLDESTYTQRFNLDWFLKLDVSSKKPYDVKKTKKINWSTLKEMFPQIKAPKKH